MYVEKQTCYGAANTSKLRSRRADCGRQHLRWLPRLLLAAVDELLSSSVETAGRLLAVEVQLSLPGVLDLLLC